MNGMKHVMKTRFPMHFLTTMTNWQVLHDHLAFKLTGIFCNSHMTGRPLNWNLEQPFSKEEIKLAVFFLGFDRAPSPDGFNMRFYQVFWLSSSRLPSSFWCLLLGAFRSPMYQHGLYHAHPKKDKARMLGKFRSINLLSGIFKIIMKVLATHLQTKIGRLIDLHRSAYHTRSIYPW